MEKINPLKLANRYIRKLEERGLIQKSPAFLYDYKKEYPQFSILERNYEVIRKECEMLLQRKEDITDMDGIAGKKTQGGIHSIAWKSFVFKSGTFIKENCELCPETAKIVKGIPRVKQVFFSILEPHQHIKPHKGYYKGFLRYHLGVIIPNDNLDKKCWIKINDDPVDNENYSNYSMEKHEIYHWKNGEGIIFDDYYLHEAANESDEVRVVMFIDVLRKFPVWLDWLNVLILKIAYQTKGVKAVAKNAKIKTA
ncbi:MAG: aspartyl/asparaginyl beta-hydroxylase (cupin superfamily) [Cyclobacteriaceae bacterium]|jgi:aspartyl/asparaginyl beta-hydroxylase (cupin superfamily)